MSEGLSIDVPDVLHAFPELIRVGDEVQLDFRQGHELTKEGDYGMSPWFDMRWFRVTRSLKDNHFHAESLDKYPSANWTVLYGFPAQYICAWRRPCPKNG